MSLEQSIMHLLLRISLCASELFSNLALDCARFIAPLTFGITIPLPRRHEILMLNLLIHVSIVPEMSCFGCLSGVGVVPGLLR